MIILIAVYLPVIWRFIVSSDSDIKLIKRCVSIDFWRLNIATRRLVP